MAHKSFPCLSYKALNNKHPNKEKQKGASEKKDDLY